MARAAQNGLFIAVCIMVNLDGAFFCNFYWDFLEHYWKKVLKLVTLRGHGNIYGSLHYGPRECVPLY